MIVVDKRTPNHTKLHVYTCGFCKIDFGAYKYGRKFCSRQCASKNTGFKRISREYTNCKVCGIEFWFTQSELRKSNRIYCSNKCRFTFKKLSLPTGLHVAYDGYIVMFRTPDGRKEIKYHRYIMEQHIGRKLLTTEIVHHKNHNKLDNRIENLQIMSRAEHNKEHFTKVKVTQ